MESDVWERGKDLGRDDRKEIQQNISHEFSTKRKSNSKIKNKISHGFYLQSYKKLSVS